MPVNSDEVARLSVIAKRSLTDSALRSNAREASHARPSHLWCANYKWHAFGVAGRRFVAEVRSPNGRCGLKDKVHRGDAWSPSHGHAVPLPQCRDSVGRCFEVGFWNAALNPHTTGTNHLTTQRDQNKDAFSGPVPSTVRVRGVYALCTGCVRAVLTDGPFTKP